jgi:hypothetical protein
MITTTRSGIPGDALNVGLEGDQADVICAMLRPAARSPRFPAQKPPNLCGANPEHFQICMVPTPSFSKESFGGFVGFQRVTGVKIEK